MWGQFPPGTSSSSSSSFTATGWSQPPHPFEVIPSVNPTDSAAQKARAVLEDYFHDDDLRKWADQESSKHAFGVKHKEDYDTKELVAAYEDPHLKVWKMGASWHELSSAVQAAIRKRTKLGPLPKSTYNTDPVVIYYYDNDRMKSVQYPKAAISTAKGFALDPSNIYWWKNHDIHTFERSADGKTWGDEGFDWDKDVAGNVGEIVGVIMTAVGAILTVIPFTSAIGAVVLAVTPLVVAAVNAADTAFQGGDVAGAFAGIGTALTQLAGTELQKNAGITMDSATLNQLGTSLGALASDAAGLQAQGLDFAGTWKALQQQAGKYGVIDDAAVKAIETALHGPSAIQIFRKGYDMAGYADADTLGAISQLFTDVGARSLFQFGAGLGLLSHNRTARTALDADIKRLGTKYGIIQGQGTTMTMGHFAGQDVGYPDPSQGYGPDPSQVAAQAAAAQAAADQAQFAQQMAAQQQTQQAQMMQSQLQQLQQAAASSAAQVRQLQGQLQASQQQYQGASQAITQFQSQIQQLQQQVQQEHTARMQNVQQAKKYQQQLASCQKSGDSTSTSGLFAVGASADNPGGDFAKSMEGSLVNALGSVLSTAATEGAKDINKAIGASAIASSSDTPNQTVAKQTLAAQVALLGPKYGLTAPALLTIAPVINITAGDFAVGQAMAHGSLSLRDRYIMGKTGSQAEMANVQSPFAGASPAGWWNPIQGGY